jgi:tripartite-type tricarboxylate transporter receptor subunit TctC
MKLFKLIILITTLILVGICQAQEWPNRPIQMIVQFPPGTTTDSVARDLAEELTKELAQTVTVINKPGAGGIVGVSSLAMAKPDGYTIGTVNMPTLTNIPLVQAVTYDPLKSFTHLAVVGPYDYGIFVNADSPWKTLSELVDYARKNPNKLSYGTLGAGTTNQLTMERLGNELGFSWNFIPYKGDNESVLALLGDQIQVINASGAATMAHVRVGKLRMLISTGPKRWSALPNVPTLTETGLVKFSQNSYYSLAGPADIPEPIKRRLENALKKILTDKTVVERLLTKYGQSVAYQSGADYAKFIAAENASLKSLSETKK